MQNLEIIRGTTKRFKFQRKRKDKNIITTLPDKMYFTVKYGVGTEKIVFQKKLNDGINFNKNDNYYYFTIQPDDTENLPFVNLFYDIKVIMGNVKYCIGYGKLYIRENITDKKDEV